MFADIWRDLVHAGRSLAKARAFTLVCVVSLGIGMVPVITIPYWARVLRMPPPGVTTDGLVELVTTPRDAREGGETWSYPDFEALRESRTGIALIGWKSGESQIARDTTAGGPTTTSVATMFVSTSYFKTLGLALARGAGFDATGDDPQTAEPVVIVGYSYWQHQMSADPDIIGKTLTLDGIPHVVVGVAPEHFSGHMGFQERQLFLPLGRYPPLRTDAAVRFDRSQEWLSIHGRLLPGVSLDQASAAVAAVTAQLANAYPATNQLRAGLAVPYDPLGYFNEFRIVETVAFTLTGVVLVVVCLNISGMMLVRSAMRERELSIRHAIGASRGRLARYLLSEAIVLASLGAVLGSIVLFNGPHLFAWAGRPLPFEVQEALRFDPSIIAICLALCLATSVVFGLLPAIRFSRPAIISSLKDDAGVGGVKTGRLHRLTAALQVAIAVPLIVLSAIALDRVRVTATGDLGFDADSLYAAPLTFDDVADQRVELRLRSTRDALAKANGVASATVADGLPLDLQSRGARVSLQVDEHSAARVAIVHTTRVGDGYLDTMGIRLLAGRGFTHDDRADGEMVTVISNTLAGQLAPNDPVSVIGKRLTFGPDEQTPHTLTIVGVTRDFPTAQMDAERAQLLLPLAQHPSSKVFLVARRADGERPLTLTAALENAVRDLGPDVDRTLAYGGGTAYAGIITGVELRQNSVRNFLERAAITGGAGCVILTLAALGIYGVVGLMVATRTREIAVRTALGASRRGVVGLILFDVVKLVTPGVIVGLLITVAIVRLKGDNLGIQLSHAEPLAYVVGAATAVLVALLASLVHARRAASIQPMVAMRSL